MRQICAIVALAVGLAAAANAATLTVFTTDLSNAAKDTFVLGETFYLKVTGDAQGGLDNGIEGQLAWDGALTITLGATRGDWFSIKGSLFPSDGSSYVFNQNNGSATPGAPTNQVQTSVVTLVAEAVGESDVDWYTGLDFFSVYIYGEPTLWPTGHSFTITPEPTAAALLGLGLVGTALGVRRPARR